MLLEVDVQQLLDQGESWARGGGQRVTVKPPPCHGKYVYNLSKFLQVSALSTIINIFTNFHSWR